MQQTMNAQPGDAYLFYETPALQRLARV